MHPIRILIATPSLLYAQFGAGQAAINLAEALRLQGHDVTLWSPYPMPNLTRWWQSFQRTQFVRSELDSFIATQDKFDIIDTSAALITKRVAQSSLVVARSTQPQILYMLCDLMHKPKTSLKEIILLPFSCLFFITVVFLLIQGWHRSTYILCLGSLELEWMKKWFPRWKSKLISYINALSKADQVELTNIRLNRKRHEGKGIRFLWIGRWTAHKGINKLVDFIIQRSALHPEDTFTIAGCGTDAEKDCPLKLIQSGRLKILPSFERKQLYSLLANHDAGLFTSTVEGWGLVLNEMLESGMPVFASESGGVLDLQPLFKNTLMPFPPPIDFTASNLFIPEFPDSYYQLFTWEEIVKNYLNQMNLD